MKSKNIVFVTSNLSNWMYRSLYEEQIALKKKLVNKGFKVFFFGPGFKNCKNLNFNIYKKKYIKNTVDAFILFGGEKFYFKGLSNEEIKFFKLKEEDKNFIKQFQNYKNSKKIIHINDFWHNNKYDWQILFRIYGITDVLSMYAPFNVSKKIFGQYFLDKSIKFHKYNRAINLNNLSSIKRNLNKKRLYDVIMIGAVNKFYPFRMFADTLFSKKNNIKYRRFKHPGYKFFNKTDKKETIGKKYYSTMENSKIVITCGTILKLPIPKIWEIMSTGAVLVIDNVKIKKNLKLINNKNYVEASYNNLKSKIKDLIINENKRKKISKNGMIISRKIYSLDNQSNYLSKVVNEILNRKKLNIIKYNQTEIYFLQFKSFILSILMISKKIFSKALNLIIE